MLDKRLEPGDRFVVLREHLELMARLVVRWEEGPFGGAPCFPERDLYGIGLPIEAVAEVAGEKDQGRLVRKRDRLGRSGLDEVQYPRKVAARLYTIHRGIQTALQICLQLQAFEPGRFELGEDGRTWRRVS